MSVTFLLVLPAAVVLAGLVLTGLADAVGLLDADFYGPSIPLMTGIKRKPVSPDGKSAYVASRFSDAVAIFNRKRPTALGRIGQSGLSGERRMRLRIGCGGARGLRLPRA